MKKRTRRMTLIKTIALLLAICMIIPLLPIEAIAATSAADLTADETEQTAQTEETAKTDEEIIASLLEPIIVEEDVTKRRENEKHFLCDDGSYIAISYSEAVHEEVNGEWVDIEYDVTDDGSDISPVDEDIKVKFANNTNSSKLVKIEADGYKLSWTVEAETENGEGINKVKLSKESKSALKTTEEINKQNREKIKKESKNNYAQVLSHKLTAESALERMDLANTAEPEKNEAVVRANQNIETYNREQIQSAASYAQSMVEYKDVFGEGMTLRYLLSPGKINEEVVLDSLNGFKSYSMLIDTDGLTPIVTETGRVDLTDEEGNVIMTIDPPYMYDSIDAISENISVTAEQESKKEWRITYTPNAEWLADTNRVYPVVIDPSVTTQNYSQSLCHDNYVFEGQQTPISNTSPYLYVGYEKDSNGNTTEYIAYWGISTGFPLGSISSPDDITDVHIFLRASANTSYFERLDLYHTTEETINSSTLTWSNKPELKIYYNSITSFYDSNEKWMRFSPSELIDDALVDYNDSYPIGIFAIKKYSVGTLSEPISIFSSNYRPDGSLAYIPYIEVEYTGESSGESGESGGDSEGSSEPTLVYPDNYTTEIASGTYIIENQYNGRFLHHSELNNTVNVWNYSEQPYQKWNVQKNDDGTYSFNSLSVEKPDLSMEVYYGQNNETQPITMYTYQESNAYKFFILKNSDNTYSIQPALSGDKVLTVFSGNKYNETYEGRVFEKISGMSVELYHDSGTSAQKWRFYNPNGFGWDTSLESGTYTIESRAANKMLTYGNAAFVSESYGTDAQRWHVKKIDDSGIYTFSPVSFASLNLELYYGSISGACNAGHVFTFYDYSQNQGSPYIKVRLKKDENGYYSIYPLVTPKKCMEVYYGENTTYTFNSRTFTKTFGETVQLGVEQAGTTQDWIFTQVIGIYPQSVTLNIGDRYDLDNIEPYPQLTATPSWTLVSGAEYIDFNSETNELLAKRVGTTVFQTLLADGLNYQFTINIPESRPIEDGYYYIENYYNQKRIDIEEADSDMESTVCQQTQNNGSKSQMWYIKHIGSSMYYIYSVSNYRGAINFDATPTPDDLAYPLEVNIPDSRYSSWFIVQSNNTQTYTLLPSANTGKALSVEQINNLDGTALVAQNRIYGSNHQDWCFIPVQNKSAVGAQPIAVGESVTGTIEHEEDFEWYKVTVPSSSKYLIVIDPALITEYNSANYYLEIYSGDSTNPTNLEKILYTHSGDQSCTIASDSITEPKTYYIKVYPKDKVIDLNANTFIIKVSEASVEGGSELEGWVYRGAFLSPQITYYIDSSMDGVWGTEDSTTYTYRALFIEARDRWNDALGQDVFSITDSYSETKVVLESGGKNWVGLNSTTNGRIRLNVDILSTYSKQKVVDTIAHELGHTLGLGDLYISQEHGYVYNGQLIDNSDHLMYGMSDWNLTTSIYGRFHEDDITGVETIHNNWHSLVGYTEDELYEAAHYIVSGKVTRTEIFNDDYTKVYFEVDEYFYCKEGALNTEISFLHLGTIEHQYYADPLYNIGEEYVLYLFYDLYDELTVVGGPQGRFLVEENDTGEATVTNQIDRIVEKEAKEKYGLIKRFAKNKDVFKKEAKVKVKSIKGNKK